MTGNYEDRPYQQEVVNSARRAIQEGNRKILIQAATGSGKTVMATEIISGAYEKGSRVVFLAHRRELVYQAYDKLMDYGVRPGIIMSGEYGESAAFVQVASIDTLRARVRKNKMMLPHADIIFIDEAHRSLAPTYLKLIREYEEKGAVIIGLSATPIRADGHGMGQVYEKMVCAPSVKELIAMGYLVQPRYYAPSVPDLVGVEIQAGDYKQAQLAARMDRSELIGDIVTNWMRIADGKKTVVFASSVEHSIHLRDEFRKFGVSAEHIDGNTPLDERDRIIGDLRNGKVRVICNCMVLTEGFDCPDLEVCVLARPTRNLGLYLQMGGRVLRPANDKEYSTIIDHSGAIYRHGFLEDDIEWALDPGILFGDREHGMTRTPTKEPITCIECGHVYSGEVVCPECGHKPQKQGRWHETRAADLMPVSEDERVAQQRLFELDEHREWWGMFKQHAQEKGFKPGWAFHKFREKFKEEPSPEVQSALARPTTREFRAWIRSRQIAWAAVKKREEQRLEEEMKERIRSQRA